jgi:DNA polymerase
MKLHCVPTGIHLPNGMMLRYPNLRLAPYGAVYDSRRGAVSLYGGKLVENVVQALARIIVFNQQAKMDQWLRHLDTETEVKGSRFKLAHSVHDEIVCVVPQNFEVETKAKLGEIMAVVPSWAKELPIACEIKSGESYGDCK